MSRYEYMAAAALVLFAVVFGVVLWTADHAPSAAVVFPTPLPTIQPTMLINNPLTTRPGEEVRADWDPAVVVCWGREGEAVDVLRGERTVQGTRYLLVRVRNCTGWTPDFYINRH